MKNKFPLLVPNFPDLADFEQRLEQIWQSKILTNGGDQAAQLTKLLSSYIGNNHVSLYANATLALFAAIKALKLTGEIVTTPFTFAATSNSIIQAGLTPVLIDVEPDSWNIDPENIESAITDKTSGIMPVHVYGNPCDMDAIEGIASKYSLRVIYDAAQAFGVEAGGRSILGRGDVTVVSTHATKIFSSVEGGFAVSRNLEVHKYLEEFKNFGISGSNQLSSHGLNCKMSELHCAFGLESLKCVDMFIAAKRRVFEAYKQYLQPARGLQLYRYRDNNRNNFNYVPILVTEDYPISRDELAGILREKGVQCREYFFPLAHEFSNVDNRKFRIVGELSHAKKIAQSVLCLPSHITMSSEQVEEICGILCSIH